MSCHAGAQDLAPVAGRRGRPPLLGVRPRRPGRRRRRPGVASATVAMTSPVEGSSTSISAPPDPGRQSPPMNRPWGHGLDDLGLVSGERGGRCHGDLRGAMWRRGYRSDPDPRPLPRTTARPNPLVGLRPRSPCVLGSAAPSTPPEATRAQPQGLLPAPRRRRARAAAGDPVPAVPDDPLLPASNAKMVAKVPDIAPQVDVLLANLEDAMPAHKERPAPGWSRWARPAEGTQLWTRVNSLDSPWGLDDLTPRSPRSATSSTSS